MLLLIRRRLALLILAALLAVPASAGAHDGEAHAKRDLAGVSVDRLLRSADDAAGLRPARSGARATRLATGPASAVGSWGPITPLPVVPIFSALLPNGKILMWDSVGDAPAESYAAPQTFTRAAVWDPVSGQGKRVDVQGSNIFCAGFSHLPDGNVLVVGGNADWTLAGIRQTHVFDWRTETWSRGPDMSGARWYPSVASQADGSALIVGGGPTVGELYRAGRVQDLPGVVTRSSRFYPFMQLTTDGRTLFSDDELTANELAISAGGAVAETGTRSQAYGDYGSHAQFDVGRTLLAGGTADASSRAAVVDTTSGAPVLAQTAAMANRRRHHTLTVLADGSVAATGGMSVGGLVNLDRAVYEAERWDPATGAWSRQASAQVAREYHSVGLLLPDGRVLSGGGGICGECYVAGYLRRDAEIFTPPYLYAKDGSGALAPRPRIAAAPSQAGYGTTLPVHTPQASSITKVGLVRLGAPTHGQDQDQRYVPLTFTRGDGVLQVDGPRNAFEAPPGYYMLFVVDGAGVPSVASMLRIDRATAPPSADARNLTLGRPATGSASCTAAEAPGQAVNGSVNGGRTDKWCSMATSKRWQVDLGSAQTLSRIVVRHAQAGGEPAAYNTRAFSLLTSVDGTTWTTAAMATANTAATTTHDFPSRPARWVRLDVATPAQTAGRAARIYEVEAYGPAPDAADPPVPLPSGEPANLALGRSATSSAPCSAYEGPEQAVNGSVGGGTRDRWCSAASARWWQVDLGAAALVSSVVVRHAGAGGESALRNTRAYTVRTSVDGTTWATVAAPTRNAAAVSTHAFDAREVRYVRIDVHTATGSIFDRTARLYEVEVLGTAPGPAGEPRPPLTYASLEGAAVLHALPGLAGRGLRLEAGVHDVARGNLGAARGDVRSIEIAEGFRATVCRADGACTALAAARYPGLPTGFSAGLTRVVVERVP